MKAVLAGVGFAAAPALLVGLVLALVFVPLGLYFGLAVFGLGLDVIFNGRDRCSSAATQ